ncbi:MAG: 16S rRNA (cytosine(1402)-N(4))-methyltransferase RsmH [Cyclobacteriaceae bacterium]
MEYHVPVLLKQSVEALQIKKGGVYVDVTFGGGGHSLEIFNQLQEGVLLSFDQDPDAAANAEDFKSDASRSFIFVSANFRNLKRYLAFHGYHKVDGILADLGVSSHQFDDPSRGFSIRDSGDLNMRMDQSSEASAAQVINNYSEEKLIHIFSYYGDIKNARTLARQIVQERSNSKIETTGRLREVAEKVAPKGKWNKYLAQLFQAIRIEVNGEMDALMDLLDQSAQVLNPGGRLVAISYHSLEDRLVKNYLNSGDFKGNQEKDFYGNLVRPYQPVTRKPIVPDQEEIEKNSRARSAKMRIGEKIESVNK